MGGHNWIEGGPCVLGEHDWVENGTDVFNDTDYQCSKCGRWASVWGIDCHCPSEQKLEDN